MFLGSRTKNANAAKAANAFPNKSYVRIDEKFYPKERQRIRKIESEMDEAIDFHDEQIKVHQTAIGYKRKKTPYVCTRYKI